MSAPWGLPDEQGRYATWGRGWERHERVDLHEHAVADLQASRDSETATDHRETQTYSKEQK